MSVSSIQFQTGGDRNFGYIAADLRTGRAALIDPSYIPESIVAEAGRRQLTVDYVFNTHGHFDHCQGNETVRRLTGRVALGLGDRDSLSGVAIAGGARLALGEIEIRILFTPGHTPDSICILVEDALFTGDTLFVGKVGGTDLADSARQQYESLHRHILSLPDDTRIFPGHDYGTAAQSTVGRERRTNPFLMQPDLESFVTLKENWPAYKRRHGIA